MFDCVKNYILNLEAMFIIQLHINIVFANFNVTLSVVLFIIF